VTLISDVTIYKFEKNQSKDTYYFSDLVNFGKCLKNTILVFPFLPSGTPPPPDCCFLKNSFLILNLQYIRSNISKMSHVQVPILGCSGPLRSHIGKFGEPKNAAPLLIATFDSKIAQK
jgi:hypothetical protein